MREFPAIQNMKFLFILSFCLLGSRPGFRETGTPIESGFIRIRFRNISHHIPGNGQGR
jgi:hypothetical protein